MLRRENIRRSEIPSEAIFRPQISYVLQFSASRISIVVTYSLLEVVIVDCGNLVYVVATYGRHAPAAIKKLKIKIINKKIARRSLLCCDHRPGP